MRIYKFKDVVDGNYAFVISKNIDEAVNSLKLTTSIDFTLIESRSLEELKRTIIVINQILPF